MKLYLLLCTTLAATLGQTFDQHPNHNYELVASEDDHEAQASDGVPSTILAPHHHHPQPHHHPQNAMPHPKQPPPSNARQTPTYHHPEQHRPPQSPHSEALKSYYPGRKRYHSPPKHRYYGPHRGKGHHKYQRRPQAHYQSVFGGRPGSKYPPRPGGAFRPRPIEHFGPRPQVHRQPGPNPGFVTNHPGFGFNQGGFGVHDSLESKPHVFGSVPSSHPGFGAGFKPQGFGSIESNAPGFGGVGAVHGGHENLESGSLGHHFEHKPSVGLDVSGQGGFDPGHSGGGNDLSDEGGSVGSESHYVGTYEGGGGGGGGKWKGGGDVAGRVKIKVFRGPTQSDGHKHFAPWGYFVSQPNEETLSKAHKPHGHPDHY